LNDLLQLAHVETLLDETAERGFVEERELEAFPLKHDLQADDLDELREYVAPIAAGDPAVADRYAAAVERNPVTRWQFEPPGFGAWLGGAAQGSFAVENYRTSAFPEGGYDAGAFTRRLAAEGLTASMGTVGDALDNAMCESLIGTMKIEKLNRQPWRSVENVRAAVFEWIETWYNRRRRHSSLGYLSPLEYESQHYDGHTITNP